VKIHNSKNIVYFYGDYNHNVVKFIVYQSINNYLGIYYLVINCQTQSYGKKAEFINNYSFILMFV